MKNIFKKTYHDPNTGDTWTFSEKVSWSIQGVVRNWWFVNIWTWGTFIWWMEPTWFTDSHQYIKWMNFASWLAVTVELVIGIAMIGQTKRDALIIRHILKLEKQELEHIEDIIENQSK